MLQMEFEQIRHLMEQRPEPGYAVYYTQASNSLPSLMQEQINSFGLACMGVTFTVSQPGHAVHTHTDSIKTRWHRFHLPIYTTGTVLIEDGERRVMHEGGWYGPIKYWVPHSVEAPDKERVHLIVDLK